MKLPVAVIAALTCLPALAQETYVLDPVHSQPGFEVRHLGMSNQFGGFTKSTAKACR